jgi:rubrerythrin
MENSKSLDILKQAILLEKRGKAFYTNAAINSKDADTKKIFQTMALEEEEHVRFLSEQFIKFRDSGKFDASELPLIEDGDVTNEVLTKSIKDKISAAGFEAAAISSAIDMENRAIAVYSERAQNASDAEERKFYQWLADWEKGHHKLLYQLDHELKEKIWFDNSFWAF